MTREWIKRSVGNLAQVLEEIPELRYLGDKVLREPAKKVGVAQGREIGNKLGEILLSYRKITGAGRGLAAPQIGIPKRVFVTFIHDKLQIYINPEITETSNKTNLYRELCLSSGVMSADVERPESIKMKWEDDKNVRHHEEFSGFTARLLQHEEAHLRGVVNVDNAIPGTLELISSDPLKEKLRES